MIEDMLMPLPLPALLTFMITLGIHVIGDLIARRFRGPSADYLDRSMGFVVCAAMIMVLVNLLALAGCLWLWGLRIFAWLLAGIGLFGAWKVAVALQKIRIGDYFRDWSRGEVFLAILIGFTLLTIAGSVLGPATDTDSLDYHLGVPLHWLRHGGTYAMDSWIHSAYAGLGECGNLLGIAAGTDGLGGGFQFAGLVIACFAAGGLAVSREGRLLGALVVVSCPVILFLVPNQKPQMFPMAAILLGLVATAARKDDLDRLTVAGAFFCFAFAVGSKYTFILTGSMAALACLIIAAQAGKLRYAVLSFVVTATILAAPVYIRNYCHYGDPLYPMLSGLAGDSSSARTAYMSRFNYGADRNIFERVLRIPMRLMVTYRPGRIGHILGPGLLGIFLLSRRSLKHWQILAASLAAFVVVFFLGLFVPRSLFGPFLWIAAVIAAFVDGWKATVWKIVLCLQCIVIIASAGINCIFAVPSIVSSQQRQKTMTNQAFQYAETRWLDNILPEDAVVLTNLRNKAYFPRKLIAADHYDFRIRERVEFRIKNYLRQYDKLYLVYYRRSETNKKDLIDHTLSLFNTTDRKLAMYPMATRNPFNRGHRVKTVVFRILGPLKE